MTGSTPIVTLKSLAYRDTSFSASTLCLHSSSVLLLPVILYFRHSPGVGLGISCRAHTPGCMGLEKLCEGDTAEIEEAALVDGCSRFSAFRRITLPLMKPGITAVAALLFILAWNEFTLGVVLSSVEAVTIPVGNLTFYPSLGVPLQAAQWGPLAATGILTATPALIFAVLAHRHIVRGLSFGAVKG